jgi:hypothetical protein
MLQNYSTQKFKTILRITFCSISQQNAKPFLLCGEIEKNYFDLNPNANVVVVPYGSVSDSNISGS